MNSSIKVHRYEKCKTRNIICERLYVVKKYDMAK